MSTTSTPEILHCSFCNRNAHEVANLIAGKGVYICDVCVQNSVEILKKNAPTPTLRTDVTSLPKPSQIKRQLDQHVIGQ
ncbi:MAG TPA: ATP-dependent Clp protease ATP-binding subunit ClpX, partial [Bacteroidetes bacterium]|nr:ATP-dependent Clp protease ATP-binding subunit ClpX [Bacteroidota bacterium]